MEKDEHTGGPFVRLFAESKSLPRYALEILSASSRVGTGKKHNSHVKRFVEFYCERYTDPLQASTEMGMQTLVCRLLKGVFNIMLALSRYATT